MRCDKTMLLAAVLALASCSTFSKNKEEQTSQGAPAAKTASSGTSAGFVAGENGLDYKKIATGNGTYTGKPGDFAELHVVFKIADSVIINSYEMNHHEPVLQQLQEPMMKGDLMEGLLTMKAGDSTVFRILIDTLVARSHQTMPPYARSGDYAVWEVKMVKLMTKEQMEAERLEKEKEQNRIDDKILQDYFKSKGIANVKKDPSGLYYVVHKQGQGPKPEAGSAVTVNYTGRNLKGEPFDSNVDPAFKHVEPFVFNLARGSVIRGWDIGVALMNKGTKATFYIPSSLAYGDRGANDKIGPNSILAFDIELLDFKKP